MSLSQWGLWSDELDPMLLAELTEAYAVRQVWLAELQAALIVRNLALAMGGGEKNTPSAPSDRISPAEMLREMGVDLGGQTG